MNFLKWTICVLAVSGWAVASSNGSYEPIPSEPEPGIPSIPSGVVIGAQLSVAACSEDTTQPCFQTPRLYRNVTIEMGRIEMCTGESISQPIAPDNGDDSGSAPVPEPVDPGQPGVPSPGPNYYCETSGHWLDLYESYDTERFIAIVKATKVREVFGGIENVRYRLVAEILHGKTVAKMTIGDVADLSSIPSVTLAGPEIRRNGMVYNPTLWIGPPMAENIIDIEPPKSTSRWQVEKGTLLW